MVLGLMGVSEWQVVEDIGMGVTGGAPLVVSDAAAATWDRMVSEGVSSEWRGGWCKR